MLWCWSLREAQNEWNVNPQLKRRKGLIVRRGIQWTDFTWNPVGGCQHGCRWKMPDGTIAKCYAETIAGKFKQFYTEGFEHDYWRPDKLQDPIGRRQPAHIFLDSMSDLMGSWVPEVRVQQVLEVCRTADWHDFQLLTKNPGRLPKFVFPKTTPFTSSASGSATAVPWPSSTTCGSLKMTSRKLAAISALHNPVQLQPIRCNTLLKS